LIIWVTLGLTLLAAGAVGGFHAELRPRGVRRRAAPVVATAVVALVPAGVVLAEGTGQAPNWPVAAAPVRLASLPAPLLLLPSDVISDYHMMLWGTEGWPVMANGSSGFQSTDQVALRREALGFPDAASVAALRRRGVSTVVVIRSRIRETPWSEAADRPVVGLPLQRTDLGDAVVFDLRSPDP
jgi:hypothetical protein